MLTITGRVLSTRLPSVNYVMNYGTELVELKITSRSSGYLRGKIREKNGGLRLGCLDNEGICSGSNF